jgi:23S rRNA (cytidine1920-2'-O)/16S rRNA (cytidine1409-2'-O)-methyltransferase
MSESSRGPYVSRGGDKLEAALEHFHLDARGLTCADLGSNVGGFVDCLLQRGAAKVYSVDTSYGTLAWKLRKDPKVVVLERVNAMHVELAERVDLVTIDVGWTPQAKVLPNAAMMLKPDGRVLTLIKPHYEAPRHVLRDGVLPDESVGTVVDDVLRRISPGWWLLGSFLSPIRGQGGNQEVFALLQR